MWIGQWIIQRNVIVAASQQEIGPVACCWLCIVLSRSIYMNCCVFIRSVKHLKFKHPWSYRRTLAIIIIIIIISWIVWASMFVWRKVSVMTYSHALSQRLSVFMPPLVMQPLTNVFVVVREVCWQAGNRANDYWQMFGERCANETNFTKSRISCFFIEQCVKHLGIAYAEVYTVGINIVKHVHSFILNVSVIHQHPTHAGLYLYTVCHLVTKQFLNCVVAVLIPSDRIEAPDWARQFNSRPFNDSWPRDECLGFYVVVLA